MKPIEKKGYLHSGITNIGIVNRKSNAIVLKGSNVALFAVKLATSFVSKYSVDTLFDRLMTACVTIDRINWQTLTHTFSLRNRLFVQNLTNTEKNQRSVFIRIWIGEWSRLSFVYRFENDENSILNSKEWYFYKPKKWHQL